jgi:hypothetical protein
MIQNPFQRLARFLNEREQPRMGSSADFDRVLFRLYGLRDHF